MSPDLLALVIALLLAAAVLTARFAWRSPWGGRSAVALCSLAALSVVIHLADRTPIADETEVVGRPIEQPEQGYVSSDTCRACHAREYATWRDSYHSSMTQVASPRSVLADFDGVTLSHLGERYELRRRGDEFFIELDDPMVAPDQPAARVERQVAMTTGSHNMQLFWYGSGHSRVTGLLPFAYQIAEQEWIPRLSAFVLPPSGQISPEFTQWNVVCNKCHATHSRPRAEYDRGNPVPVAADTRVSEFGIACEACHGPAAEHVALNRNPAHRYAGHLDGRPDESIVNPFRLAHVRSVQVCGQCHGNFDDVRTGQRARDYLAHGFEYRPGDDLEQTRKVSRSGWDEQFWSDGVPRVAGREYNGLVGSGCYERGEMSCLSCHAMHQRDDDPRPAREWADDQLRHDLDGDQSCLQCHQDYAADVAAHTHHALDSAGSRCQNCHMPHTSYGLLKGIRNHRIESPDIANTVATGRPNACNQCHLDRSLGWTAAALQGWYGIEPPTLSADDSDLAAGVGWALRGDAAQRALVAWSLGWGPAQEASGTDWMAPYLAELIDDPYDAVRIIAARSARKLPGHDDLALEVIAPGTAAIAKSALLARWRPSPPIGDRRTAVLIRADGTLDLDAFRRVLARRDHRKVSLFE